MLYGQDEYEGIIRYMIRSRIPEDINHDRRQVSMLPRQIQKDLNKIGGLVNLL